MTKIHLLDDYTINQIAAGEIIESPASIIKELIENSLDADSSAITVEIKRGGKEFIRVTDNGIGMNGEDAKLALQRHATSKISNADDLELVSTLGFRGEALASIAAVTQFEMLTRTRDNISGTHIINHGGEFIDVTETGCPEGTTIIVRNLFFNTPARLKFLKSTRAESARISDIMGRLIIGNPNISIRYINNDKTIYHSPGNGNLMSAIMTVYGSNIEKDLIPIRNIGSTSDIDIEGYIGKPSVARASRVHQSFYINNRYIDNSKVLTRAVEDAYKNYITVSTYPWVVLHISIPANKVDVNIHPAKIEVRFRDERKIYGLVCETVANTLERGDYIPTIEAKPKGNISKKTSITSAPTVIEEGPAKNGYISKRDKTGHIEPDIDKNILPPKGENEDDDGRINSHLFEHNTDREAYYKVIGTFLSTYILIEKEETLYIIDQHAAHERILYEKLKKARLKSRPATQLINPPIVIDVTHNEGVILERSLETFDELGFEIEPFGGNAFIIRGIPAALEKINVRELFFDILDDVAEDGRPKSYVIGEEHIITCACRRAIKANDPLDDKEIRALFKQLDSVDIKQLTCPHGRPVMIRLSKYELEKYFKRVI